MKSTLEAYRKSINQKLTSIEIVKTSERRAKEEIKQLENDSRALQEAREIFQKAAILTQNHLAKHLSSIVTKAIRTVFHEKNIEFLVEFKERRNNTECDMWFVEEGRRFSLLDSRGYGMVDIASFALRVSYVLLGHTEDILIIDEPFRNLSEDKHVLASQMIKELSSELGMQFIISTHMTAIIEYADKAFNILQKRGVSKSY